MPKSLRPSSLIACLPALAALVIAGCDRKKDGAEQGNAAAPAVPAEAAGPPSAEPRLVERDHKGARMPAVPFAAPGGAPATLGPMRGHPVLLNLWATWCQPCVKELPTLDALATQRKGALAVVAVSQDTQGEAAVKPFWKTKRYRTLVPYTDAKMVLTNAADVAGYPVTILYDSRGREVWRVSGDLDWTGPAAAKLLAEAS